MNKFTIHNLKFSIFLVLLFASCNVSASTLSVQTDAKEIKTGEVFTATVILNTEGRSINTVEGDLKYNDKLLKAEVINIGSSFVSLWVEKPTLNNFGVIHFSGITPGGVSLPQGEVFRVIFRANSGGRVDVALSSVRLFLNDGQGSLDTVKVNNSSVIISGNKIERVDAPVVLDDKYTPEKFNILRSRDSSLFDNKYFIVFDTTDKDSGISKYRICEFFSCRDGDSPYLLKNQSPFYYLKVIAYDVNGNTMSSSLASRWLIALVALVFGLLTYIYRRYFHNSGV